MMDKEDNRMVMTPPCRSHSFVGRKSAVFGIRAGQHYRNLTNDLAMMPFCSCVETRDPSSAKYGKMMNNKIMVMTWAMVGLGPDSWEGGNVAITGPCYCSRITVFKLSN